LLGDESRNFDKTLPINLERRDSVRLHLDVSTINNVAVVRCRGRIVFGEESDELRRVVLGLLNETKNVVLNFAWIGQLDSNGLGALVASFISARHHGARIKFAALSPAAQKVLTPTRVEDLFEVYDSTDEALRSFHSSPDSEAA
jgi:anti-sigma B factor antagonist